MDQPVRVPASIEVCLREKWTELLDVHAEEIVTASNFFGLGGNSMLMLSLHVFMSQAFGTSFSLAELFGNAEFGAMVQLVKDRAADKR